MTTCKLCGKKYKIISSTHLLSRHNSSLKAYRQKFGEQGTGFFESISTISMNDPRRIAWRESLKKRPQVWSKGRTKSDHPSIAKMVRTFKKKKINNFSNWRKEHPVEYALPEHSEDLAFLVGLILGDGNIHVLARTEQLKITLGTDKPALWQYAVKVVEKLFVKTPAVYKVKRSACVQVTLYQKHISARLGIPPGRRGDIIVEIPQWINRDEKYIVSLLKGLYEAEGSFNVHLPTYTYKLIFSNRNDSLLDAVYNAVVRLGFHPHRSPDKVQISRKNEVFSFKELISFREYKTGC